MRRTVLFTLVLLLGCGVAAAQVVKDVDLIGERLGPENFQVLEGGYCIAVPTNIPDNDPIGVTTTIDIPCPDSTIEDLDLIVQISHTWVGDLSATLTHAGSGSATVMDRPGVPDSTFGCSGDDIDAIINDEATDPIEEECAASVPTIQGEFVGGDPADNTLMATWDGEDVCGTWELFVVDQAGGDTGFVAQWCVKPGTDAPEDGGGDGGGGVPSTTSIGVIVLIALVLGTSAYFLRRRATS